MPRVTIRADDGRVTLDEHVRASDFETEHFRHCLAERLWWATEDAERTEAAEAAEAAAARDTHATRRRRGAYAGRRGAPPARAR